MIFCRGEHVREEEGLVIGVNKKRRSATIKVGRHDECTECGACAGRQHLTVEASNKLGAKAGQRVRFQMYERQLLKGAFITFIMPLILAGIGAFLGWLAGRGTELGSYVPSVCTGAAGFMCGVVLLKRYDQKVSAREQELPVITEILR